MAEAKSTTVSTPPLRLWQAWRPWVLPVAACATALLLLAVLLHEKRAQATGVGMAERVETAVATPEAGRVVALLVAPHDTVVAGDVVAVLDGAAPWAELAALEAAGVDFAARVVQSRMRLSAEAGEGLEQLRVGLRKRIDSLKERAAQLSEAPAPDTAPDSAPDSAAEAAIRKRLEMFRAAELGDAGDLLGRILDEADRIGLRCRAIAEKQRDSILRAPQDGVVASVRAYPHAFVEAGATVATLQNASPGYVLAYFAPAVLDRLAVGGRAFVQPKRRGARAQEATIAQVGPAFVAIPEPLHGYAANMGRAEALPVRVGPLPAGFLYPGEPVSVAIPLD